MTREVPGIHVVAHQRTIRVWSEEMNKWLALKFDIGSWEKLIRELNNPPDLGVEVADAVQTKEEISGS